MLSNPLSELRDIHLPDPISFWPLAPGWYILFVLCVCTLAALSFFCIRYYRQKCHRRAALKQLQHIITQYQQSLSAHDTITALSHLLRQVALTRFPRQDVASLHGNAWLNFLDKGIGDHAFSNEHGHYLINAAYQATADIDPQPLFVLSKTWIKNVC